MRRCWGITLGLSTVSFVKGSLNRTNGGEEKWFPPRLVQRKWKKCISASPPNLIGITGNVLSGQAAAKGSRSVTVHTLIYSGSCIILYISLLHCLRDGGGSAHTSRHVVQDGMFNRMELRWQMNDRKIKKVAHETGPAPRLSLRCRRWWTVCGKCVDEVFWFLNMVFDSVCSYCDTTEHFTCRPHGTFSKSTGFISHFHLGKSP